MRFLALYRHVDNETDVSLLRRIKVPFSTLSKRGHRFEFMAVPSFRLGISYSADITILPNWHFTEEEYDEYLGAVLNNRPFVYDLSDPRLLDETVVWKTMQQAALVTVPNERLKQEVANSVPKVAVTPSCLDVPYFMNGNSFPKPVKRCIGCFGPYDWYLVRDAVAQLREEYPAVTFLGDSDAQETLGNLVEPVDVRPDTYPLLLRSCLFGLCPSDGPSERDDFWRHEYGILCKPTIQLQGKQEKEQWVQAIKMWLQLPDTRIAEGQKAFQCANQERGTLRAGDWLKVFQKKLPYLIG